MMVMYSFANKGKTSYNMAYGARPVQAITLQAAFDPNCPFLHVNFFKPVEWATSHTPEPLDTIFFCQTPHFIDTILNEGIIMKRHSIQFPPIEAEYLNQDETFFYLKEDGKKQKILFHDYSAIYNKQGLYEQLFYDRLKCQSPRKVTEALKHAIDQNKEHFSELKVLDLGAGNGMMGEELKKIGVARLVGADIIEEAKIATERDRPGIYDKYFVKNFTKLADEDREEIKSWHLNALTTVGAIGFGDIPPFAFIEALNLINHEGWVAFNIKDTFLYESDTTGFSKLIRQLISSEYLNINRLERYRHRLSIDGKPLFYFSLICWKKADFSMDFIEKNGLI